MPVNSPVTYRIDSNYTIVAANPAWHQFYLENGDGRRADAFMGDNLLDHIHSAELKVLYRRIFDFVRTRRQSLALRFRCDSPSFKREMEMYIAPHDGGGFDLSTRLISEEPWPPDSQRRHWPAIGILCGWCDRVKVEDQWQEIPQALQMLRAFPQTTRISHGVCPQCKARLLRRLK